MNINGVFVKSTKEIIFSRCRHDFHWNSNNKIAIDGGFDYLKICGDINDVIFVKIDGDYLLKYILKQSYLNNKNIDGLDGVFKIGENSNIEFFKKLITNFNDIRDYIVDK